MTMAVEQSFKTILLSLVFSFRVCQASNTSFALPFLNDEFHYMTTLSDVRLIQPLNSSQHFGGALGIAVSHDPDHKKENKNKDDFTISTVYEDVPSTGNMNIDVEITDTEGTRTKMNGGEINNSLEKRNADLKRQFSSMNFPSLETALLSLAFLTFAVFVINLVQDLLRGSSSGRKRRSSEDDDRMTDVIVLALSSIDTWSYGTQNPVCGQKLLCHLNRSGWHNGLLGSASNYIVSLLLSVFSPKSNFQKNLDAAHFGKENEECTEKYSGCPSVLGECCHTKVWFGNAITL